MPYDGSGNYTPAAAPNNPAVSGNTIVAAYYNNTINDLATALSQVLTRDGQGKPSAPINWNNQDLTGVATFAATSGTLGAGTITGALGIGGALTGVSATFTGAVSASSLTLTTDLAVVDGGTGQGSYTDGQLLIGNTTGNTLAKATLTAGTGISIVNGSGTITISTTSSGTVTSVSGTGTVNGLTLTGTVTSSGNLTLGGTLSGVSLSSAVTGTLPVANGGTGSTTASGARSNLGAAASGANGDITQLDEDVVVGTAGNPSANTIGYRGTPYKSGGSGYTLAIADAGYTIGMTSGTLTIPANSSIAFPTGTTIVGYNNSGSDITVAITSDTMYLAGVGSTGSRTVATRGLFTLVKVASTTWIISGAGVS